MDQVKIGKFIAEMRKEQKLTQKQLADKLDISDRTISKWECGKGMPDVGLMIPLCEEIKINVNELLSGERLPEDHYSRRAEENMIRLIEENENKKKKESVYAITYGFAIFMVIAMLAVSLVTHGLSIVYYLDFPTLIFITVILVMFLLAAGLFKDFFHAFVLAFKKEQHGQVDVYERAENAVWLAIKSLVFGGLVTFLFYFVFVLHDLGNTISIGSDVAVAALSLLYGIFLATLLLPVRVRLRVKISELNARKRYCTDQDMEAKCEEEHEES
ncbi:MAG: helix-turn-helix domain-containing protein [Clostridium sp.]|nr:helix-turn-helix domain-containing protein [Clostridium sp.]MCM1398359.1 helix-turn-helix domain-containing protein [Clostridium sp.]MCM1458976.1 helix-turn-helix domain-containing protein [Bacteroides sp.]